jgi:hypothetical protein
MIWPFDGTILASGQTLDILQRGLEHSPINADDKKQRPRIARKEIAMAEPTKPDQVVLPPDPYPDYRPVYTWVFQSWLIMFLGVVCIALLIYLLSYIPK